MEKSPKITDDAWGSITVQFKNETSEFKDVKLYPGGVRGWDWAETGTSHNPGIQVADVEELIDNGSEMIILSCGRHNRLQVKEETKEWLQHRNISFKVLETGQAIDAYNEARNDTLVGALIHTTC